MPSNTSRTRRNKAVPFCRECVRASLRALASVLLSIWRFDHSGDLQEKSEWTRCGLERCDGWPVAASGRRLLLAT